MPVQVLQEAQAQQAGSSEASEDVVEAAWYLLAACCRQLAVQHSTAGTPACSAAPQRAGLQDAAGAAAQQIGAGGGLAAGAREEEGQAGHSCDVPGAGAAVAAVQAGGSCSTAGQRDTRAHSSRQQGPAGAGGSPGSVVRTAGGLGQITGLAQLVLRCPAPPDACLSYASACAASLVAAMQSRDRDGGPGSGQRPAVAGPAAVSGSGMGRLAEAGVDPRAYADGQLMARLQEWQQRLSQQRAPC